VLGAPPPEPPPPQAVVVTKAADVSIAATKRRLVAVFGLNCLITDALILAAIIPFSPLIDAALPPFSLDGINLMFGPTLNDR
jgi:hypothetical protein